MRNFAFLILGTATLVFPGCGDEMPQTAGTSSSSGSSSSGGPVGPCTPWGTWNLTYANDGTPCALTSDTVTITQNADGSTNVVFAGDDTMPMSMCGANPEPGVYSTNATLSADGCSIELTSNSSYCFSGESQCEKRNVKLTIDGDAATGSLTHDVCW
ncbi:MAG TPA: hypothetical protein PKA58_36870, partial [Polyangium sp.]|nr:hypothetical protein [Polyangium sp.]